MIFPKPLLNLGWTPGTGFGCNALNGLVSPITQNLVFTGQIGISLNATTLPTKQVGTVLQLGNADTIASRIENDAFAAPAYFTALRFDGTNVSPTTLQANDEMGGFNAWGYNGSSAVGSRGTFRVYASQNWTGSAQGTYAEIGTTLNNTTTMAAVCRFENDGGVTCPATVTGGDQGAGRINAAGLFVNGVAVSTGSNALSGITAALANNSIENGAFTSTWTYDTLTTQTALGLSSTSVTGTGKVLSVSAANPGGTGYAGYFSNSTTSVGYGIYSTESGALNTGYAGYFANSSTGGYAIYASGTIGVAGNAFSVPNVPALSTATFTPDFSTSNHFKFVLVHASCPCTIAAPLNAQPGQSGVIKITQSSTGSDTITWNSVYKFAGATAPTLSTGASASDFFGYFVDDSSHIIVGSGVLNAH